MVFLRDCGAHSHYGLLLSWKAQRQRRSVKLHVISMALFTQWVLLRIVLSVPVNYGAELLKIKKPPTHNVLGWRPLRERRGDNAAVQVHAVVWIKVAFVYLLCEMHLIDTFIM